MSKGGQSGPSQTVTQKVDIPSFLQPFLNTQASVGNSALQNLNDLLSTSSQPQYIDQQVQTGTQQIPIYSMVGGGRGERGQRQITGYRTQPIYGTQQVANPNYDPNGTSIADKLVAPFNADQLSAFNMARGLATGQGSPYQTATAALQQTANGDYLYGTPASQAAIDAAVRAAQPSILSTFGAAGRGGGGLERAAIAQQASDAFANLYNSERQRQLAAAGALPGVATAPINLLSDIGNQQYNQAQQRLTAPISAEQMLLQAAGGGVPLSSVLGSTQTGTQSTTRNVGAGILGGASTGLGIGAMMAPEGATGLAALGGPWGLGLAAGGALLGGLLS